MSKVLTFEIPDELYEVFEHMAARQGRTAEAVALEYMARHAPQPPPKLPGKRGKRLWRNCLSMRERSVLAILLEPTTNRLTLIWRANTEARMSRGIRVHRYFRVVLLSPSRRKQNADAVEIFRNATMRLTHNMSWRSS